MHYAESAAHLAAAVIWSFMPRQQQQSNCGTTHAVCGQPHASMACKSGVLQKGPRLANINSRVEAVAAVKKNVAAQDELLSSEDVNLHLTHSRTKAAVVQLLHVLNRLGASACVHITKFGGCSRAIPDASRQWSMSHGACLGGDHADELAMACIQIVTVTQSSRLAARA